jgi:Ni,Fe-hydrogenase I cytochrome b subunit
LAEFVSALSLGPRGWIQIANFLIFGLLLFAFSRAVAAEFQRGRAARWGIILLTVIAVGYFVSGPFVMDPTTGTPNSLVGATFHGLLHGIMGGIVFLLMPIVMFVFLRRFHLETKWQFLQGWTWVLGIICAVDDIFFTAVSKSPDLSASFSSWMGLIQRSVIIPFMIWVFIFALGMYRSKKQG